MARTTILKMPRMAVMALLLLFLGLALIYYYCNNTYAFEVVDLYSDRSTPLSRKTGPRPIPRTPFSCPLLNTTFLSCHAPEKLHRNGGIFSFLGAENSDPRPPSCPEYFRWIHEDLRPWKETGITKEMVERAGRTANFRLVVVKGRLYVESYGKPYQTRDLFQWWGFVQLLKRYPGQLPDLDLMFDCDDIPVIKAGDFAPKDKNKSKDAPPPLFRYCKDEWTLDIPFPDWSFWGWSAINIKPWARLREEIREGNRRKSWVEREPYAFWKGNPSGYRERKDLLRCNWSPQHDWKARIFIQNWGREARKGFRDSNLADQCTYRYKIYVEGNSWSVSQKYIIACDSLALIIQPRYHEFYTRGMVPMQHYWPIRSRGKCEAIEFAVGWGNNHTDMVQAIARNGSTFIMEQLKMDYVYDYMFHLLNEYAKLLRYKPKIPRDAVELCEELMLCNAEGVDKAFMLDSVVDTPKIFSEPCTLPASYSREEMASIMKRKEEAMRLVENWETEKH